MSDQRPTLIEVVEPVPTFVTLNEEGQVCMDVRFWQSYASRANRCYQALLEIQKLPESRLDEVPLIVRKALEGIA